VPLSVASLLAPAVAGGLLTWSWQGALTAFFWGGLVRMALAHHVTCSINSVCHVVGDRPFQTRKGDRAANFWPLALLSFGESWHNSHHADPTCARHGVLRGQIDPSARLIWLFERLGWVDAVRWPDAARLAGRRMPTPTTTRAGPRSAGSSPKRRSPGVGDQDPARTPLASASSRSAAIASRPTPWRVWPSRGRGATPR
jgi:stearoyl-CoA desaturase (delta-9 desaturase)